MDRVEVPAEVVSSQGRVRTTIRVDAYLKELVEAQIRKVGIPSLCFLTENLWRSWLTGEMTLIPRARPVTVNMTVNYGVTRPRRYPGGYPRAGGYEVEVLERGRVDACFECGRPPRWMEFLTLKDGVRVQAYACDRHHEIHEKGHFYEGCKEL